MYVCAAVILFRGVRRYQRLGVLRKYVEYNAGGLRGTAPPDADDILLCT